MESAADLKRREPDVDYTTTYRLIADEGYMLVSGDSQTYCVDTDTPSDWDEAEDETINDITLAEPGE